MYKLFIKILWILCLVILAPAVFAQATFTDRQTGSVVATVGKQPVAVATTANITLSGVQTIDGVTVSDHAGSSPKQAPDRVLVKNQTDQTKNGIYVVSSTGPWYRAQDMRGPSGVVMGQLIKVNGGSQNGLWNLTTTDPVVIDGVGASNINFAQQTIFLSSTFTNITGQIAFTQLPTLTANSLLGALTTTTPSAISVPSCAGASQALTWTSGVGFGCNTITASGSTVNTGSVNQIAYYSGTSAISGTNALPSATTATTPSGGDNSTKIATTAFVNGTPLTLTNGTTAATQASSDNSSLVATTAYVKTQVLAGFTSCTTVSASASGGCTNAYASCAGGYTLTGGGGDIGYPSGNTWVSYVCPGLAVAYAICCH